MRQAVWRKDATLLAAFSACMITNEPDRRLELLHDNLKNYGTVFNTVTPGTDLKGVRVRAKLPQQ